MLKNKPLLFMGFSILMIGIMSSVFNQEKPVSAEPLPLKYLVRQPKIKSENPPLLLLLHGVGSNENDLFSLADGLDARFLIVSARAPYTISEGSYKWYEVGFAGGAPRIDTAQAEKSRQILIQFLEQLKTKHAFDAQRVYLCGFSQGAIMSFSVGLTQPELLRGIIDLSGRVLTEIKPKMAEKSRFKNFKTLVIHGTQDNVLPIIHARQAKQLLDEMGINTEYHEIETGHNITRETLDYISAWLGKER